MSADDFGDVLRIIFDNTAISVCFFSFFFFFSF